MQEHYIHSKNVLINNQLVEATLWLSNGKIKKVIFGRENIADVVSYDDAVIMPGLIDSHVHINEPGRTDWEGFDTATKAAAAGGITTLVDMPLNSTPVTTTVDSLYNKIQSSEGKLHVNCGFYGGIVPDNLQHIKPLIDAGVFGIKAFLTHSGIDDFPNVNKEELRQGMEIIAKSDVPILAHCELSDDQHADKLKEEPTSFMAFLHSRPTEWEDKAIELMIDLCSETGCKTHIVHLSAASSIAQLKKAITNGLPITVETCSHYLYFNAEDIPDGQTVYKCAPPIREKRNNEQLWKELDNGILSFIITDHSPASPDIKELNTGNLLKAWGGIAGLQFSLPAIWQKAEAKGWNISTLSDKMSVNVSKFLGLENSKGKIKEGFDADLVVWNPEKKYIASTEQIVHKHKISAYVGHELKGEILSTYVNGNLVYHLGEFREMNQGRILLKNR